MTEPLSLAASVAGLVSLSVQLLQITTKFASDVNNAPKEVRSLVEELSALQRILALLKTSWQNERLPPGFDLSALAGVQSNCEAALKDLLQNLTKASGWLQRKPQVSLRSTLFRLKWPFEADKTKEITQDIHRYYSIFAWTLHHRDSEILFKASGDVCQILRNQDELLDKFRTIFKDVSDVRQKFDTAIEVISSVLYAVEGQGTKLDQVWGEFAKIKDENRRIEVFREREYRLAKDETQARRNVLEKIEEQLDRKFVDQISSIPYRERHVQALDSHQPGTGTWFLSGSEFRTWRDSDTPSMLICKGSPGAGKTVLTSLAIENIMNLEDEQKQIAYLYCDREYQCKETVLILLQSILQQLLTKDRLTFCFVRDKCNELFVRPEYSTKLLSEIIGLIRALVENYRGKTYLFVDAVDEIADNGPDGKDRRHQFLEYLFNLSACCHVFVTCRPHILPKDVGVLLGTPIVQIRASDEDVRTYVDGTLRSSRLFQNYMNQDAALRDDIINAIQERSKGVFLLAKFHMATLATALSPMDVRKLIQNLSSKLTDIYDAYFQQLRYQPRNRRRLALRALAWVSRSTRPLSDHELAEALSFVPGDNIRASGGIINISLIIEACGGFLWLTPSSLGYGRLQVAFTHATIAEYVERRLNASDIHFEIANTSLGYLSTTAIEEKSRGMEQQTDTSFMEYATTHWGYHAANTSREISASLLLAYARKHTSAIFDAAIFGLSYALKLLLRAGLSPNVYEQGLSPLALAVANNHESCVAVLLKYGAFTQYSVDMTGPDSRDLEWSLPFRRQQSGHLLLHPLALWDDGTICDRISVLVMAIVAGNIQIVEQLLQAGCNPDTTYNGMSPIHVAILHRQAEAVIALIKHGADVNLKSTSANVDPLAEAARVGQWKIADILIANGAVTSPVFLGLDVLQNAAYEGMIRLVNMALNSLEALPDYPAAHAVEIRMQSRSYCDRHSVQEPRKFDADSMLVKPSLHAMKSPLHLALEGRHDDVAYLLIENRVSINMICGFPPYSALEWASERNNISLVQHLLAAGADPDLGGQKPPLLAGSSRFVNAQNFKEPQSTTVIGLLLDAGASPAVHNGVYLPELKNYVEQNVRLGWWRRNDPNVTRLYAVLDLSDQWMVL